MQWNKPKSLRQIGSVPGRKKVYVEDYVMRFARKLAEQNFDGEKAAVLLGATYLYNEEKIYQISGIVEIPDFYARSGPKLSEDTWDKLYSRIKENFTDLEIVGWFYSGKGFSSHDAPKLLEIHKQNFQHRDKVLYLYEGEEREDTIFLYRGGGFEKQKGYYIYYEKNPEMLAYMEKENNRHIHIVEQEDDRVVRNIRGVMEEKEHHRQALRRRQQRESRFGYSLGVVLALIVAVAGVSTLKNQRTLGEVKNQVDRLQELALGNENSQSTTTVETMAGGLTKMTATPAAVAENENQNQEEAASGEAVSAGAVTS